jgi:arylsulfatase A-like enzyme
MNRPFFMHLSFQRPHPPHTVPSDSGLLYNPDEIVLPESAADLFENKFKGHHAAMEQCFDKVHGCPYRPRDKKELRRQLAFYYSLITYIDEQIGRVLNFLKEAGDYDNTVIIFTSDHGDFAGEHGLILKNLGIFESLHRIPFIIAYPGCPAGKVIDKIVESVDMYPTICKLAAIDVPDCVDGRSMLDIIENDGTLLNIITVKSTQSGQATIGWFISIPTRAVSFTIWPKTPARCTMFIINPNTKISEPNLWQSFPAI